MKKLTTIILTAGLVLLFSSTACMAAKDSSDLLKEGLLGAGAGAVGGAASGAEGDELWKGALAGAGTNIVGGAILDSITGEKVNDVNKVQQMGSEKAFQKGYHEGYSNGYKKGFTDGYKQGLSEAKSGM